MIKVYLSGPINSKTKDGLTSEQHKQAFTDLAVWLKRQMGHWEVVNPCEVGTKCTKPDCGPFDGHDWNCWLKADLKVMLDCDAICLLPSWEESAGALLESNVAQAVGMTPYFATPVGQNGWLIR